MPAGITIKGNARLRAAVKRAEKSVAPKDIRRALRPAARLVRRAAWKAAPVGETKLLRRSVVVRSSRRAPILFVAADRKKALRVSPRFPRGFPYVNAIISESRRGAKADPFVRRGAESVEDEALDLAADEVEKLIAGALR